MWNKMKRKTKTEPSFMNDRWKQTHTDTYTQSFNKKKKWIMPKSVTKLTCYLCIQRYEQTESKCWTNNNDDDVNDVWKIESNKKKKWSNLDDGSFHYEWITTGAIVSERKKNFETVFLIVKFVLKLSLSSW